MRRNAFRVHKRNGWTGEPIYSSHQNLTCAKDFTEFSKSYRDPLAVVTTRVVSNSAPIVSLFSRLDGPVWAQPTSRSVYRAEQTAICRPHRLCARTINLSTCWITIASRIFTIPTIEEDAREILRENDA